jgi:protein involved in polysaccharide export with SLBB domain
MVSLMTQTAYRLPFLILRSLGAALLCLSSLNALAQMPSAQAAPTAINLPPVLASTPDQGAIDFQRVPVTPVRASRAEGPSQFQRFVQESTGKLLPLFGASLFENPSAYATDNAAPAPSEYVLGPGDQVRLHIWGAVEYVGVQTLDRGGQISLPKVGAVNLNGIKLQDLEPTLRKQIATVFTNVNVSASLGKLRGITVYVVGQARQPGTFNLSSLSTLVNAVFASGGPGVNGSMRRIELKRGGQTVTTLDLYDFIAKGDKSRDAALQPGDVIMIPPAGPRIALTGATDHGGIYEILPGTSLQDVLNLGGGLPVLTSQQKALIERIASGQTTSSLRQVQNLTLDAQGVKQVLQDADVVTLLPISPAFANAVTLQGLVAQPLRHVYVQGMRVLDLIPDREALVTPDYYRRKNQLVQILDDDKPKSTKEAGSRVMERVQTLLDQINWDYAVIERLNKAELRTELIPFNLGKAVIQKDPAHNLLLQAGDVLTIMSSADLQLPVERRTRLVRVEGEVMSPGVYQALAGETLPQLIRRLGGLTAQAYAYGTEFTRESVRRLQQQNLDQVIRRLEAQSQSASATLAANLTGERASQVQSLQQQQQQQLQAQIARLKSLRSKGRVALELDTDIINIAPPDERLINTLPNLVLEDGDAILVPSQPSFVSAAGSVNNENVMLYKPGKTVGDVISAAGLYEDAEVSEIFVLRADGSLFTRKSPGWFQSFEGARIMPGDTLIVPTKIDRENRYNFAVRALKDWTQILSNLGIGAIAIKSLSN